MSAECPLMQHSWSKPMQWKPLTPHRDALCPPLEPLDTWPCARDTTPTHEYKLPSAPSPKLLQLLRHTPTHSLPLSSLSHLLILPGISNRESERQCSGLTHCPRAKSHRRQEDPVGQRRKLLNSQVVHTTNQGSHRPVCLSVHSGDLEA